MTRLAAAALLLLGACRPEPIPGPLRLLEQATAARDTPTVGALSTGGETRPALLGTARWRVALPERALLTFGIGVAWSGDDEAPGWYQLTVRARDEVLFDQRVNPRERRGYRDISLPLQGLGAETLLEFEVRLTDRHGTIIDTPPGLLLGVAAPTLHDLASYGDSPGIVLISIDTLRRDHVGAYGYAPPTTPRLDALAREGLLCEDAVSTSSWTLPAHLSMLTSADPGRHGGTDRDRGFNRQVPTLPERLREAGFATQALTSHLYVSSVYGLDAGFDHLDFRQDRKAGESVDRAIALLDRLGDRPFFLFLHLYDPHWHYDPPPESLAHFESGYTGDLTGLWQDFSRRDPAALSPEDMRHLLALYDGEIRYTDDQLGRLFDHMGERGLDRGTLIVVTSDHGEEFLEHGAFEHQRTLYEEVIRVPLLLRGPGIEPGRIGTQTSLLDVAPTLLDWAGLPPLPDARGHSLLQPLPERRDGYGETDHTADGTRKLFLRTGADRRKAILSLDRESASVAHEEWYDLAADPGELANSAPGDSAAETARGRALARWREGRAASEQAPTVSLSDEQTEQLRALGYIDP